MVSPATERVILRWIHIIVAIPVAGYVYSPFKNLPDYAPPTRYVFLPIMIVTGLWMWKGYLVRALFAKRT